MIWQMAAVLMLLESYTEEVPAPVGGLEDSPHSGEHLAGPSCRLGWV
jgi:hypothetical protein